MRETASGRPEAYRIAVPSRSAPCASRALPRCALGGIVLAPCPGMSRIQFRLVEFNESAEEMKTHAQAVVIGGGLVGCSIAYHLTKLGCKDVVLLERNELTSGSTWHAAANIHGLHDSNNITKLQYYTMKLYEELEQETGQSCGINRTGSIYLAQTRDRKYRATTKTVS